jgi:hypothetical protein
MGRAFIQNSKSGSAGGIGPLKRLSGRAGGIAKYAKMPLMAPGFTESSKG